MKQNRRNFRFAWDMRVGGGRLTVTSTECAFLNIFAHTPVLGATLQLIKEPVHVRTLARNSLQTKWCDKQCHTGLQRSIPGIKRGFGVIRWHGDESDPCLVWLWCCGLLLEGRGEGWVDLDTDNEPQLLLYPNSASPTSAHTAVDRQHDPNTATEMCFNREVHHSTLGYTDSFISGGCCKSKGTCQLMLFYSINTNNLMLNT